MEAFRDQAKRYLLRLRWGVKMVGIYLEASCCCYSIVCADSMNFFQTSSDALPSTLHDTPCKRFPGTFSHIEGSLSFSYNSDSGSSSHRRLDPPLGWRGLQFYFHRRCSCMCNYCKSESRHQEGVGWRRNREVCHRCCIESNRYAIDC